jgi:hypothetical protein
MKKARARKETGNERGRAIAQRKIETRRVIIGLAGFEKVSAIEGLPLTRDMKETFRMLDREGASTAQRRAAIIKKYG